MSNRDVPLRTAIIMCMISFAACSLVGFAFPDKTVNVVSPAPNNVAYQCGAEASDISEVVAPPPIIEEGVAPEPIIVEKTYSDEDLDLLSRIIYAEVGCTWIPDQVQLYTGSVVLNRVASDLFPNTIYDVVYQKGQYSPTWNGSIDNTPDERTIANAKKLLEEGSVLPVNVVFQSTFIQGTGIYDSYYDEALGTTTYFCYGTN